MIYDALKVFFSINIWSMKNASTTGGLRLLIYMLLTLKLYMFKLPSRGYRSRFFDIYYFLQDSEKKY